MTDREKNRPFDDNPEWTEEDFARARPASEVHRLVPEGLVRKRGRPAVPEAERKQPVSIRLSPDVLAALRATGDGWQTRVDELLKVALGLAPAGEYEPMFTGNADATRGGSKLFERMADVSRSDRTSPGPANEGDRVRDANANRLLGHVGARSKGKKKA